MSKLIEFKLMYYKQDMLSRAIVNNTTYGMNGSKICDAVFEAYEDGEIVFTQKNIDEFKQMLVYLVTQWEEAYVQGWRAAMMNAVFDIAFKFTDELVSFNDLVREFRVELPIDPPYNHFVELLPVGD
jgi:hypothetical protein